MKKNAIIITMILFFTLLGCNSKKFNERLFVGTKDFINPTFLNENRVRYASYKNQDNDLGDSSSTDYYTDDEAPLYRIITINDKEMYEKVFNDSFIDVDFDREVIYIYIYAETYAGRKYSIHKISIENDTIIITCQRKKTHLNDGCEPSANCLIVVMDKTGCDTVKFELFE